MSGEPFGKKRIHALFKEIQSRLNLAIRVVRRTTDPDEISRNNGSWVIECPVPFEASQLVRSLVKSGIPVEVVFEVLSAVADDLLEQGFHNTEIDRVELIRTVGSVLRSMPDIKSTEWAHEYHNRYGWDYEFQETDSPPATSGDYIRTTDLPRIDEVIRSSLLDTTTSSSFRFAGRDAGWQDSVERDFTRITRRATRSVRSTGLHTVSESFVRETAKEIANWTLNPPRWTPQDRSRKLERVTYCLSQAAQALATGQSYYSEAEGLIGEAVAVSTFILSQRFELWVGALDHEPLTVLGRFADRLEVARRMKLASESKVGNVDRFFGGEIFNRLAEVELGVSDLQQLITRLSDQLRRISRRSADTESDQVAALRAAITLGDKYKSWLLQLISDRRSCPPVQSYFEQRDLSGRQAVLDSIVHEVVKTAGLTVLEIRAHAVSTTVPALPALHLGGKIGRMTFVSIASERGESISRETLERRVQSKQQVLVVAVSPNGFAKDAKEFAQAQQSDNRIMLLVGAEGLKTMSRVPQELPRLLDDAATALWVSGVFQTGAPATLVAAFRKAGEFAVEFHHQAALHGLATELEEFTRTAMRGWCLAVYGKNWVRSLRELTKRIGGRLDLGTCLALLNNTDFKRDCRKWLIDRGIPQETTLAALFPPELNRLLASMTEIRNRSAHGANQFYGEDYKQFRTLFDRLIRLWIPLSYWPRLLVRIRGESASGTLFSYPETTNPVAESRGIPLPDGVDKAFVFAGGWSNEDGLAHAVHVEAASIYCARSKKECDSERWNDEGCSTCVRVPAVNGGGVAQIPPTAQLPAKAIAKGMPLPERSHLVNDGAEFKELLDALDTAFPDHEDFVDFCEDTLAQKASDFPSDKVRSRWRKLFKHAGKMNEQRQLLEGLCEVRPKVDIFRRLLGGFDPAPASYVLKSAWQPELLAGVTRPVGRRTGLFVGVNRYAFGTGEGHSDLKGCIDDANDIRDTLAHFGCFDGGVVLTDDVDSGPSLKEAVEKELERLLATLGPEDVFCFFFAGHGTSVFDADKGKWKSVLVLPRLLEGRVVGYENLPVDWINEKFRTSKVGTSLRILDCCNAGQDELRASREPFTPAPNWLDQLGVRQGQGHCTLAACDHTQFAREISGRGLVSRCVGESLRGRDVIQSGPVAIDALRMISEVTARVVAETSNEQTPRYDLGGRGAIVLTAVIKDATSVQVS